MVSQKNHLNEMVLLSTQNKCLNWQILPDKEICTNLWSFLLCAETTYLSSATLSTDYNTLVNLSKFSHHTAVGICSDLVNVGIPLKYCIAASLLNRNFSTISMKNEHFLTLKKSQLLYFAKKLPHFLKKISISSFSN